MARWSDGPNQTPEPTSDHQSIGPSDQPTCQRCNFPVPDRLAGCKEPPCPNCGTLYPLGDCSD